MDQALYVPAFPFPREGGGANSKSRRWFYESVVEL